MFSPSAAFYNQQYEWKDYAGEARTLHTLIQAHTREPRTREARTLLDVGCGTGAHLVHLREHYTCAGLDLDDKMLAAARLACPDVTFTQGDMTGFDLRRQFDVVVCLFNAIAFTRTPDRMRAAIACMARHLCPGGLLLVEPFLTPEEFKDEGVPRALFINNPRFKLARMHVSRVVNRVVVVEQHFLVARPEGVTYAAETHEYGLFTREEMEGAFHAAGLRAAHVPDVFGDRPLYVGTQA